MDSDNIQHQNALLQNYTKRLRALELKQATLGINTPVEIEIEIEELRKKVASLEMQAVQFAPQNSSRASSPDKGASERMGVLEVVLRIDYEQWNEKLQDAALRAFAAVMEIPVDKIRLQEVKSGSVRLSLRVPEQAAFRFVRLYEARDALIGEMGVVRVTYRPLQGITEPPSDRSGEKFSRSNVRVNRRRAEDLQRQLEIQVRNLGYLEEQAAYYGPADIPLRIFNEIKNTKQNIARIEENLSEVYYGSPPTSEEQGRYFVTPRPFSIWLWAIIFIFLLVVLLSIYLLWGRSAPIAAVPTTIVPTTQPTSQPASQPTAQPASTAVSTAAPTVVATTAPSVAPPVIPSAVPSMTPVTCFTSVFSGIPDELITELAVGETMHDVPFPEGIDPRATPLGVILTDGATPVGAIRFSLNTRASVTKVVQVVEADCTETDAYHNAIRPSVKDILENNDFLELSLGGQTYAINLNYRGDKIRLLAKQLPT